MSLCHTPLLLSKSTTTIKNQCIVSVPLLLMLSRETRVFFSLAVHQYLFNSFLAALKNEYVNLNSFDKIHIFSQNQISKERRVLISNHADTRWSFTSHWNLFCTGIETVCINTAANTMDFVGLFPNHSTCGRTQCNCFVFGALCINTVII